MDYMFGYQSDSDRYTEGGDISQVKTGDISEKDNGIKKSEGQGNKFPVEEGRWKCGVCMVLNKKGGKK